MKRALTPLLVLLAALALSACAGAGVPLAPSAMADPAKIEGTYTVHLYSVKQSVDTEGVEYVAGSLAILDLEGDEYEIELAAPEYDFRTVRGLPAAGAVASAEWFISLDQRNAAIEYRKIAVGDRTIGYEAKPETTPLMYRKSRLNVRYYLVDGHRVKAVFETTRQGGSPTYGR